MRDQQIITELLEMLDKLCNGLEWNIESHPTVMTEADCEALAEARALITRVRLTYSGAAPARH